jgi:dihydroneopterin aldolase
VVQRFRSARSSDDIESTISYDAVSADFGAPITWTTTSERFDPVVTVARALTSGAPGNWDGVQPIEISVEIDVLGYGASERKGAYFDGCG